MSRPEYCRRVTSWLPMSWLLASPCHPIYSDITWAFETSHITGLFVQLVWRTDNKECYVLLALSEGGPPDSHHKGPVMWETFPCYDVTIISHGINFMWVYACPTRKGSGVDPLPVVMHTLYDGAGRVTSGAQPRGTRMDLKWCQHIS